ncbi:hypothetical protein BASA83_013669 [Batrachochytrium salamandrivorans]|nr:hypothetical protein BASA83_013669 [Batrachochytrium salamandrivorans]
MSDHIAQVQNVLRVLQDNGLYCKAEKCHFYKSEIKYLGYIISADGLRMDPSKSQLFRVGRHQIKTGKVFAGFETAFAKSDFLTHPDDSRPFILETDASDYAISGMNSAEQNYEIYDKELLAVVESFKHWRHFLQGGLHPVTVCAITRIRVLHDDQEINSSSGSLVLELSEYDFSLTHRPGKLNGRADSLSRREDYKSNTESSNFQRIWIRQSHLGEMQTGVEALPFPGQQLSSDIGRWQSTALYVTTDKRVDVMKHYHTSLAHLKYGSIIDLLLRRFWWPSMKKDLKDFIARCPECQLDRSSSGIHAPLPFVLCPQLLPFERWGMISMVHGRDQVREQVSDYLHRLCDSMGLGQAGQDMTESAVAAFLYELMMTYGAPFEIISDRGKSFLAEGIDLFERENKIRHLAHTLSSTD